MQTFEYKTIIIREDEDPVQKLNAEGQNGWEVIYIEKEIWMKRKLDKVIVHRYSNLRKGPA